MSISEVFFVAEAVASMTGESINDTVDCFWLINDIEIELWEELISVSLTVIEFTGNGEVFQVFIINEYSYRVSSAINFKASLFKCFDNDQ